MAVGLAPAQAVTMKECGAQYNAAKTAGTLSGQSWNAYRKSQCGATAAPASGGAPAAALAAPTPIKATATARSAAAVKSSAPAPSAATGNAVFPTAVSPKYSQESAGLAREHTCLDQYRENKTANANANLKWIQKGGGYYSECSKRLKGA